MTQTPATTTTTGTDAPAPIHTPHPLPEGMRAAFERDGWARVPGVFTEDELAPFARAITAATLRLNDQHVPLEERSTYDRAFLQVMNLWREDAAARAFVEGKRLAKLAADLLGVRGVRLYHDQSLYKEPGGGLTPAHADQFYWPLSSDRTVTAWVPLQPVPMEMGPLGFYTGSQAHDEGRDLEISDESEARITANMEAAGYPLAMAPFAMGDVSFHRGWTFHKAGPNRTDAPRSVMTVIYMDADMTLTEPTNPMQQNDWDSWCPGAKVGAVIDTPLNPVLWEAEAA